jgi:hypothetical protein
MKEDRTFWIYIIVFIIIVTTIILLIGFCSCGSAESSGSSGSFVGSTPSSNGNGCTS